MLGDDDRSERRADFFARLSAIETIAMAFIALVVLGGLMLVGKGFYVQSGLAGPQTRGNLEAGSRVLGDPIVATEIEKQGPATLTTGSVSR